ncbi:proline and serine-rich protein 1-like isoform X1 [Sinocyclocheilus rhinocerous]|uniref:Proline and serine-rich protein 1-like n=1 Tax=Sinocyclocheilus rhinocerous TaxID=307959 RepID=A0A673HF05_9TELE|nr:PREDICTED: proline and serine-rich protein 1-like isoform X1 [Sinocyclocheilus rhinocerous]
MDKKSFDIVLDEIRKCVLTDQRIKAIEQVHGYFSSEQVIDILKYFSWAEPQIKAVKALQHKMVAIPTTKVANILNCFTFSKDRIIVLELIALNISDAQNFHPVDDAFRTYLAEKQCARRILEQVCKVGCKAPVAMISSCGMIPGNPYPKGKPSQVTGTFPRIPAKKDGDDATLDGKGIAARILGPSKPSPSTYNPHRPVPYPIPPCRPHATIAPSAYNNAGLVSVGGVITANVPPPPYRATPNLAGYSRPISQQNPTFNISGTPAISPNNSTASTPATSQPQPTTPITPVFPGMVPSQNPVTPSPTPAPSPSVIKGPPVPAGSPQVASNSSGHTTPVPSPFPGMPPSGRNTPSVIKSHTPSGTPCGTPGPSTSIPSSPFHSAPHSETPTGGLTSTPRATGDPLTPHGAMGLHSKKGYPPSSDSQSALLLPGTSSTQSHSVIRSYTPSGMSSLTPGRSTPSMQGVGGLPVAPASSSPKPSPGLTSQTAMSSPAGVLFIDQHASSMARQSGGSGSNSPVPSAFKGPSRSGTPSLSSLVMPNSAVLARPLGMAHGAASPQSSLPSTAGVSGLHNLSSALGSQARSSPAPHFPAMSPFHGAQSSISTPSTPTPPVSSVYSGLAHSSAPTPSPFGLGLTTAPSVFPGLPSGPNPAFPGFGGSGPIAAGSPVLSSLMGLPGASSSVATVAPLQAAAVAAAAAAGVPSSSPVLPGFASAFSSNFNPALVGQAGLTGSLQAPGGAAFPGFLSFPPGMPSFSTTASPAALSGLHNSAMQSALLQAHSASALDSYPPQPNGFTNYPAAAGSSFPLQPGLHPPLGWQ